MREHYIGGKKRCVIDIDDVINLTRTTYRAYLQDGDIVTIEPENDPKKELPVGLKGGRFYIVDQKLYNQIKNRCTTEDLLVADDPKTGFNSIPVTYFHRYNKPHELPIELRKSFYAKTATA